MTRAPKISTCQHRGKLCFRWKQNGRPRYRLVQPGDQEQQRAQLLLEIMGGPHLKQRLKTLPEHIDDWVASYQLIREQRTSSLVTQSFDTTYTYDPTGNRLVKSEFGTLTTSTFDAANQLQTAINSSGTTTYTFDAAGNQQIDRTPGGTTTRTWDYENQQTLVLLPSGTRETMTYTADRRMQRRDP